MLSLTSGCLEEPGETSDLAGTSSGSEDTGNTANTFDEDVDERGEELTDVVEPAAGPEYEFSWS